MTNAELRQLDAEADSHQADADAHRARLAVASARSYARNTRDPLAAAEGDLLGEALGVLEKCKQRIMEMANANDACWLDWPTAYVVDSILARAKGGA